MKIAVSSQNFRTVTTHAGKARRWIIYNIDEQGNFEQADKLDLPKDMSISEFDSSAHGDSHPIFDVDAVIVGSCGEGFPANMAKHGVLTFITNEEEPDRAVANLVASGILSGGIDISSGGGCCGGSGKHHHHHHHAGKEQGSCGSGCGCHDEGEKTHQGCCSSENSAKEVENDGSFIEEDIEDDEDAVIAGGGCGNPRCGCR